MYIIVRLKASWAGLICIPHSPILPPQVTSKQELVKIPDQPEEWRSAICITIPLFQDHYTVGLTNYLSAGGHAPTHSLQHLALLVSSLWVTTKSNSTSQHVLQPLRKVPDWLISTVVFSVSHNGRGRTLRHACIASRSSCRMHDELRSNCIRIPTGRFSDVGGI